MREYRRKNPECREYQRDYQKQWLSENPDYKREYTLKSKYGITSEEYDAMFEAQDRRCANLTCRATEPGRKKGGWHLDHCHDTGSVRGILCHHCNCAIGYAKEDPKRLRGLADYVEKKR